MRDRGERWKMEMEKEEMRKRQREKKKDKKKGGSKGEKKKGKLEKKNHEEKIGGDEIEERSQDHRLRIQTYLSKKLRTHLIISIYHTTQYHVT